VQQALYLPKPVFVGSERLKRGGKLKPWTQVKEYPILGNLIQQVRWEITGLEIGSQGRERPDIINAASFDDDSTRLASLLPIA
jgi:hypothetical protein